MSYLLFSVNSRGIWSSMSDSLRVNLQLGSLVVAEERPSVQLLAGWQLSTILVGGLSAALLPACLKRNFSYRTEGVLVITWNCFGSERVRHRISRLLSGFHVVIAGIEVLFVFSLKFFHQHRVAFSFLDISIFGSERKIKKAEAKNSRSSSNFLRK